MNGAQQQIIREAKLFIEIIQKDRPNDQVGSSDSAQKTAATQGNSNAQDMRDTAGDSESSTATESASTTPSTSTKSKAATNVVAKSIKPTQGSLMSRLKNMCNENFANAQPEEPLAQALDINAEIKEYLRLINSGIFQFV